MPPRANQGLNVREGGSEDCAAVAEIYNFAIEEGRSSFDTVLKTAADIQSWLDGFNGREVILVLERDRHIVGWGIIKRYSDRAAYRVCCETAVYLRPEERRKGYGTFLKKAMIARCRHLGYHHLVAKIAAVNVQSIEFNKKLGYEVVGRQREIGFMNGHWHDVVIMQLILDDVMPGPHPPG